MGWILEQWNDIPTTLIWLHVELVLYYYFYANCVHPVFGYLLIDCIIGTVVYVSIHCLCILSTDYAQGKVWKQWKV